MIIERRLKYIGFHWDDETQELVITTYYKGNLKESVSEEERPLTGEIILNKTYLFSTMRFMIRIAQRMWGRRKKR